MKRVIRNIINFYELREYKRVIKRIKRKLAKWYMLNDDSNYRLNRPDFKKSEFEQYRKVVDYFKKTEKYFTKEKRTTYGHMYSYCIIGLDKER